MEEALQATFLETGKAIILTSIILFSGFMILIFSIHPPRRTVGRLISVILLSAVIADLMLIPFAAPLAKKIQISFSGLAINFIFVLRF